MENEIKEYWSNSDYDEMGWHDCALYSISFVNESYEIFIDIDYIFDAESVKDYYIFTVAPARMVFADVVDLVVNLNSKNILGVSIIELDFFSIGLSPNGMVEMYKCVLSTDIGFISFNTSGFVMKIIKEPIKSEYRKLGRKL